MSWILIVEQSLNGLQFGLMLFMLAAGLTLVFGIMDMINLAHGSLYMLGAFLAATLVQATGSFAAGVLLAIPATALLGMLLEMSVLRTLYAREHLGQMVARVERAQHRHLEQHAEERGGRDRDLRPHTDPQRGSAYRLGTGHAALRACRALGT